MTAERGNGGRFTKRTPADPGPAPAAAPIALTIRPLDADPGPAGSAPPDAPPADAGAPGADGGASGPEAPAAAAVLVAVLDGLIGRALGAEFQAKDDDLDAVRERAAPVILRAADRVGLGEAAGRAMPEWADELVKLGAAVYVAWADAIMETWARAVAARREAQDAEGGPGGGDHEGDGWRPGDGGPGGDGARRAAAAAAARPIVPDGPVGPAPGYGDLLARRASATRGVGS